MMQRLHSFTSLNAMAAYRLVSQALATLAHARKPLLVKTHVAEDTEYGFLASFSIRIVVSVLKAASFAIMILGQGSAFV
jgi:hypothetical protein